MARKHSAPYVPSPPIVVDAMLDLAEIIPGQRLCDLGSGDGRIVIRAASRYYARAVGVENNPKLALLSQRIINSFNLQRRAEILYAEIEDYNYRDADVVIIYLTRRQNEEIKPKLENELKEKAKVVSHDYEMKGWKPSKVLSMTAPYGDTEILKNTKIFLYKMNKVF